MQVAIHRPSLHNHNHNQTLLEEGRTSDTFRISLEEASQLSANHWRLNDRYTIFFAVEYDAHGSNVSFPIHCLDQGNEYRQGGQIIMDGFHLVSPPVNIFNVKRGPHFDVNYRSRSSPSRNFAVQHGSGQWNKLKDSGSESSIKSSVLTSKEKSGDILVQAEKKRSRKKGKKRVKQSKKASSESGSAEIEQGDRLELSASGSSLDGRVDRYQSKSNGVNMHNIIELSYTDDEVDSRVSLAETRDTCEEESSKNLNSSDKRGKQTSHILRGGRSGKENSIWQKVQRNDADHSKCNFNNVNMLVKKHARDKVPRKSKRKTSPSTTRHKAPTLDAIVQLKELPPQSNEVESKSLFEAVSSMKNGRPKESISDVPSQVFLPHLFFQTSSSFTDQTKPTQKWIPKDSRLTTNCAKPDHEDNKVACTKNQTVSPLVDEIQTPLKQKINSPVDKYSSSSNSDLEKITRAVNDACNMQMASKALHEEIGYPIAEFEKLLHVAPPIISCSSNCQSCSLVGESLCTHNTPNVSLGCVWQCYEKLGSYGLEVKAEDHGNSNRLGADRFSFRAYYVPFLSAVQLFKSRKTNSSRISENSPNPSIFSILIPRPRSSNATGLQDTRGGKPSPASNKQDRSTFSNGPELLFEYFETDAPQLRRPLYEKIQELVRGVGSSEGRTYGDLSSLYSIKLDDLEPNSWYAVSWYPIYKIPDGNLRTAFLTYHSLGHWSNISSKVDCSRMDQCVVSPVVGLQSYNSQGECWFQLRNSAVGPSRILKERLRTLEETASCMSRALVTKGNLTSTNRHPDYEFFLSRRR
ncbi:hypothetical protein ACFE04_024749 [Oxalis oulophora]